MNKDYIEIKRKGFIYTKIKSESLLFKQKQNYIIKHDEEKIVFEVPNLDYFGQTHTYFPITKTNPTTGVFHYKNLPIGIFKIDEDSTVDTITVYFEEKD